MKNTGWKKDICQVNDKYYENNPKLQNEKTNSKVNICSTVAVQFENGNSNNKIQLKNPNESIAKSIIVFMKVQACYPEFTLDKTMLNFWECKVYERKKISILITNKHTDLPLDFSFDKISFFTASPSSGIIPPCNNSTILENGDNTKPQTLPMNMNFINIDIIFHPEGFGNCSDVISFRYINNQYSFPIHVLGSCKAIGKLEVIL